MAAPRRRSRPRPWRFIVVGGLLGFVLLGLVSMLRPDRDEGFDVAYDPSVSLGLLSLFGLFGGALIGLLVAALLAERTERSLRRADKAAARARAAEQEPTEP